MYLCVGRQTSNTHTLSNKFKYMVCLMAVVSLIQPLLAGVRVCDYVAETHKTHTYIVLNVCEYGCLQGL